MIEWLRARWLWVAAGAAILGALLVGFFSRLRSPVSSNELRKSVEDKTRKQEEEAERERDRQIEEAEVAHAYAVDELEKHQEAKVEELKDKPEETTEYLLNVGKKMREP